MYQESPILRSQLDQIDTYTALFDNLRQLSGEKEMSALHKRLDDTINGKLRLHDPQQFKKILDQQLQQYSDESVKALQSLKGEDGDFRTAKEKYADIQTNMMKTMLQANEIFSKDSSPLRFNKLSTAGKKELIDFIQGHDMLSLQGTEQFL